MSKLIKNINIKKANKLKAEKDAIYNIQEANINTINIRKNKNDLEIINEDGLTTTIEDFYIESNVELAIENSTSSTNYSGINNTTDISDTVRLVDIASEMVIPTAASAALATAAIGPGFVAAGAGGVALIAGGSDGNSASSDAKPLQTPTVKLQTDSGTRDDSQTNNAALEVSEAASDVTRTFSINGGAASTTYTAPTTDGDYTVVVTDTDTAGNTCHFSPYRVQSSFGI